MDTPTSPLLVIYIAWHPLFEDGAGIAKKLYSHYRRALYDNITGGAGLSVMYRYTPIDGSSLPLDINLEESATSAVILLIDDSWCSDPAWVTWAHSLLERSNGLGLRSQVFPIAISSEALKLGVAEQFIRWHQWATSTEAEKIRQLLTSLTYQFCRMLRTYLEGLRRSIDEEEALEQYLRKVEVFLSHSKHDANGVRIATLIREYLYNGNGFDLGTFFDVHDIPPGLQFNRVILKKVQVSAVVAIHTDSYSSREWCRREVIEAKRYNVPLVVANCISEIDERSFPYMGNVPIVRMDPVEANRIHDIVGYLLDEVLKDFLWRCRIQPLLGKTAPSPVFLPRPPELISLAGLNGNTPVTMVYPDPPIGAEEQRLFEEVAPQVQLRSITEWMAATSA